MTTTAQAQYQSWRKATTQLAAPGSSASIGSILLLLLCRLPVCFWLLAECRSQEGQQVSFLRVNVWPRHAQLAGVFSQETLHCRNGHCRLAGFQVTFPAQHFGHRLFSLLLCLLLVLLLLELLSLPLVMLPQFSDSCWLIELLWGSKTLPDLVEPFLIKLLLNKLRPSKNGFRVKLGTSVSSPAHLARSGTGAVLSTSQGPVALSSSSPPFQRKNGPCPQISWGEERRGRRCCQAGRDFRTHWRRGGVSSPNQGKTDEFLPWKIQHRCSLDWGPSERKQR